MGQEFKGKSSLNTIAPTVGLSAYASLDQMGPAIQIENAVDYHSDTGLIMSIVVIDKSKESSALDILFFRDEPIITSADNAQLDIAIAEMTDKYLGRVSVCSYIDLANCSVAQHTTVGILVRSAIGVNSLWAVLQCKGTPTYTGTDDLTIKVGIIQD